MESLLHDITSLLLAIGPWVVFAVVAVETAAFVGLLVPAEATVLVAAFLADRGYFALGEILAATLCGGVVGDHTGYLLGRFGGSRIVARGNGLGRLWHRHEAAASDLFRRHSALSVSLARFLSFIRTLMPWFAGMSRMPYGRFLVFDALGVLGWGIGSILLGYLAGESWNLVASTLGTVGGVAFGVLLVAGLVLVYRRRQRVSTTLRAEDATAAHARARPAVDLPLPGTPHPGE
ncbi:MAG TPA: DedA family protein [Longimicrobiales bacterium]